MRKANSLPQSIDNISLRHYIPKYCNYQNLFQKDFNDTETRSASETTGKKQDRNSVCALYAGRKDASRNSLRAFLCPNNACSLGGGNIAGRSQKDHCRAKDWHRFYTETTQPRHNFISLAEADVSGTRNCAADCVRRFVDSRRSKAVQSDLRKNKTDTGKGKKKNYCSVKRESRLFNNNQDDCRNNHVQEVKKAARDRGKYRATQRNVGLRQRTLLILASLLRTSSQFQLR